MQATGNKFDLKPEDFGPLDKYIQNDNVTDINYNGTDVWIDDLTKGRYKSDLNLTADFVNRFSTKIADRVSAQFNQYNPLLEAETETLRVSIVHESVLNTGRSISIRKTPVVKRLAPKTMVSTGYCSQELLDLLIQCVHGKMNMMMCGLPGTGKTELLKFLTGYIPDNERAITIEDNLEIHYSEINPGKDCVEMKVDDSSDRFNYVVAIKACLRQLPQWILLSEARSTEVKYLIESMSTGTHCLTTIHTDDVRKVPDRVKNMVQDGTSAERVVNDVFMFLDVAILIKKAFKDGRIKRYIDQFCFFSREDGENITQLIVDDGQFVSHEVPQQVLRKFEASGIKNPFNVKENV